MPPPPLPSIPPPPGGGGSSAVWGVRAVGRSRGSGGAGPEALGASPPGPRTHSRRDLARSHFELGQQLEQRQPDHRHQAGPSTSSRTIDIKPDHRHQAGPSTSSRSGHASTSVDVGPHLSGTRMHIRVSQSFTSSL
ncbi:hypothetical protein PCASD_15417 [Puccinia coronata f. sp. avenae]|uniref:Uncharacterized protein n=1 Tax=Puccinia coronata f. sp. avenae TaxID=200324 RepID=A0A2N5U252_9BASI|nr:hypothetical protein PCASD_15417 [Puccinia coronata f. sp. avenae]